MAAIWVVFGHSAVISKNEKWSAIRTRDPRLAYPSAKPLYHHLQNLVHPGIGKEEVQKNSNREDNKIL